MWEFVSESWGFLGWVLSILLSLYLYSRTRRVRDLAYAVQTTTILWEASNRFPLSVVYGGKETSALSISRVRIWNSGTQTIDTNHIALPLSLSLAEGSSIVDATIESEDNPANQWSISGIGDNQLTLPFEFVDPGEGVIITVAHCGKNRSVALGGAIKGCGKPKRRRNRTGESYEVPLFFGFTFGLPLMVLTIAGVLGAFDLVGEESYARALAILIPFTTLYVVGAYLSTKMKTVVDRYLPKTALEFARNGVTLK